MSRVPWHLFQARQPRPHLIVAVLEQPEGPVGGDGFTAIQAILKRLVSKQKPTGAYGMTVVRDASRPELGLAFGDEGDAQRFANTVNTEATDSYPGLGKSARISVRRREARGYGGVAFGSEERSKASAHRGITTTGVASARAASPNHPPR